MEEHISKYKVLEETRKKTRDTLVVYAPDGMKELIQNHAKKRGETVNEFGKRAIETMISLDNTMIPELSNMNLVRIRLRFKKGERAKIKTHAKNMGENMSEFMYRSMLNLIELDESLDEMKKIERWENKNGKV